MVSEEGYRVMEAIIRLLLIMSSDRVVRSQLGGALVTPALRLAGWKACRRWRPSVAALAMIWCRVLRCQARNIRVNELNVDAGVLPVTSYWV